MLIISQIKYLQKILDEFPEVLTISKSCPSGDRLFKIREDKDRDILWGDGKEIQSHCSAAAIFMQESTTRH